MATATMMTARAGVTPLAPSGGRQFLAFGAALLVVALSLWALIVNAPVPTKALATNTAAVVAAAGAAAAKDKADAAAALAAKAPQTAKTRSATDAAKRNASSAAAARDSADKAKASASDALTQAKGEAAKSPFFALFGLLAVVVLWLISVALGGSWNPLALAMGLDNRLSTSKLQVLLWTACIAFVYSMIYADRVLIYGFVDAIAQVPNNVLIALGLSATSAVGAKVITSSQVASNPGSKDVRPTPSYDPSSLVSDDGSSSASLSKVQFLFWTTVAIVVYLVTSFHSLAVAAGCPGGTKTCDTLPDIDTMLMVFMGLGNATYLGTKIAGGTTPAITAVADKDTGNGTVVTLTGSNFGTSGDIYINGAKVDATVVSWNANSIAFALPAAVSVAGSARMSIAVAVDGAMSSSITYAYTAPKTAQPSGNGSAGLLLEPLTFDPARAAVPLSLMKGIDVSYVEEQIDWDAVKDRGLAQFVFARASYGMYPQYDDDNFQRNHDECKRLGVPFGTYHFYRFTQPGLQQAEHFISRVSAFRGQLRPMVDVEADSGIGASAQQMIAELGAFINRVESALGTKVIIYTNQSTWNDRLGGTDAFAGHQLWVCNATNNPQQPPAMPSGFPDGWTLYQYSFTGTIPLVGGASHDVDLNVLKGGLGAIAL